MPRHRRPFLVHGLVDVAVDQRVDARLLFFGQIFGKENDSTQCAGLGRNRDLGFIVIVPDLDGDEANQQGERMPKGGSIPGETALKARARSSTASLVTTQKIPAARR